jgi:hypothetical protein
LKVRHSLWRQQEKLRPAWLVSLVLCGLPTAAQQVDSQIAQQYEARATYVEGQVSRVAGKDLPWALSEGETVPVQQAITTGLNSFARFEVNGGSSFEIFANSRVLFRQNAAAAGDLIYIQDGRVKVIMIFAADYRPVQRVITPVAIISARANAVMTVIQEDDQSTRVDVLEGQVSVRHALLPRGENEIVKAGDAIIVRRNEPISRKMDRGSIYRYALRSIVDALSVKILRRWPERDFQFANAAGQSVVAAAADERALRALEAND